MTDVWLILLTAALFCGAWLLVRGCERLAPGDAVDSFVVEDSVESR